MAKRNREKTEDFLSTMRDRFAQAEAAESEIRVEAQKDLEFLAGEQWNPALKRQREAEGRPALTFNKLHTYVAQVSNEARQNKASVKFGPVDSGSDIETAEVLEGMARGIQYRSRAPIAYETAVEYSSGCSFGHFRLLTDYCGHESFDQEIKYGPIFDPFSVYGTIVPACFGRKPEFALVVESMSRDEYKRLYPKCELVGMGFDAGSQMAEGWITDEIRLAEYWTVEHKQRTMRRGTFPDGRRKPVYIDELEDAPDKYKDVEYALGSDGLPRERDRAEAIVTSRLVNGVEILPGTETTWLGRRIPIFTVLGRQVILRGRPQLFSLIRWMRDPQQLLNVYKSGIAENVGLANRVPYIGVKGQFRDPKWKNANSKNYPYLEVEPVTIGGQPAGLPQRQQFEAAIQALSQAASQEIDDLKASAGIFDASLGAQGNETSGIAIERRRAQSGLTNFHFVDNLTRAQHEAGEELGYLIPRVYDTEREVRIIGEDDSEKIVRVNAPYVDEKTGEQKSFLLDAGQYDVTVVVGATTETARKEALEQTNQAIQAAPALMSVIGDILFRNSDNPAAQETAERMKKWISLQMPGLIEDENAQKAPQIPPEVQQQIQQSGQMIDQLTQQLQILTEEVKTKRMELDSRERIEEMKINLERQKLDAQILLQHEQLGSKEAIVQLQEQLALLQYQIQSAAQQEAADREGAEQQASMGQQQAHEQETMQQQQAHDRDMAQMQQDHAGLMQGQQQAHEGSMADRQAQQMADAAGDDEELPEAA